MKPVIIFAMLTLAATVAIFLHARKTETEPPPAKIASRGLERLIASLKPGQSVSLHASDAPGETFLYVRLALAPRQVRLFDSKFPTDTVLYASRGTQLDEILKGYVAVRQMKIGDVTYQLVITR